MDEWEDVAFGSDSPGSVSIEPIGMGAPSAQVSEWEDVAMGPPSVTSSEGAPWWGKAASGYLEGVAQMADFGQMVQNPTRMFLPEEYQGPAYGETVRNLFDTASGVEGSTKIGEGGGIHTAASYVPQAVLGPEKRLANLVQTLFTAGAAGTGRELGGAKGEALGVAASLFGPVAASKSLTKAGQALERKSVGASYGDYLKTSDALGRVDLPEGDIGSFTKQAITEVIESGKLGSSRSADKIGQAVGREQRALGKSIGASIDAAENAGAKAIPMFPRATEMLDSGAIPADELPRYEKRFKELLNGIMTEGRGSVRYLQNQKIAIGGKYDTADGVMNKFNRALYHDIQETIEKTVPEVGPLNQELSKWKVMDSIVKRGIAREESSDIVNWLKGLMRTTGGIGTGIISGAAAGASAPAMVALGLAGAAASTPRGMDTMGKVAKTLGAQSPALGREAASLSQALDSFGAQTSGPSTAQGSDRKTEPKLRKESEESTAQKLFQRSSVKSTPTAEIEKQIDENPFYSAVYEVESSRGKKLTNKKSSAKGAFQLIDKTAKSLGVEDPLDLKQNFEGFKKLTAIHQEKFGDDPRMLYAAHFLGEPLLRKVMKGKELDADEREIYASFREKALPRFDKIYAAKLEA